MKATYGWVFIETDEGWRAANKAHTRELYNNYLSDNIIKAKDVATIQALLIKHEGLSAKEINQLYKTDK